MIENAEYITADLDESFLSAAAYPNSKIHVDANGRILTSSHQHHVHYCKRDMEDAIKHMFSLTLDNLKANSMQYQCNISNIWDLKYVLMELKLAR